jgi:ATP-dependent Clp protease protease subunit
MPELAGRARRDFPGEPAGRGQPPDWLRAKLFERRILLVTGRLDDAVATETAAALLSLDASSDEPIEIHLNSADGTLEAAFALIDTLGLLRAKVSVYCHGQVAGPAIGVVAAADRRVAAAHTRFRLGQTTAQFSGTADEIAARSRQHQDLLWRFQARLAQVTGRPAEEIADDMRRGRYLDAYEALVYGLVDTIGSTTR